MTISINDRFSAHSSVFATSVDGELVIMDPEAGLYFGAGAVGEHIWSLILEGATVCQMRDRIVEKFSVDPGVCEKDLLSFLEELTSQGLIVHEHGDSAGVGD